MVVHFLRSGVRLEYYSKLINSFCDEVRNASEKNTLFKGLKVVLHKALDIGDDLEFTKTLISSSPEKKISEKSGGWIKSFFKSDEVSQDPRDKEKLEVLNNLETVISTCLFCIANCKLSVEISKFGIGAYLSHENSKLAHPALEILNPIMSKFPNEFIKSLFEI